MACNLFRIYGRFIVRDVGVPTAGWQGAGAFIDVEEAGEIVQLYAVFHAAAEAVREALHKPGVVWAAMQLDGLDARVADRTVQGVIILPGGQMIGNTILTPHAGGEARVN